MKVNHPADVIRKPVLTEESTIQSEVHNKFVFRVDPRSNKRQIREAIEEQFKVRVLKVNTMMYMGKTSASRRGAPSGARINWKKAIVTLRRGDTIDLI